MFSLQKVPGFQELLKNISDNEKSLEICNNYNFKKVSYFNKNTEKNQYILKYDKKMITQENTDTLGLIRSVVINQEGEILSFAPPKSYNNKDDIVQKESKVTYLFEPFYEGTMIHLYYNKITENKGFWEISTRSNIGANNYFYNNGEKNHKTFKEMFYEACELADLKFDSLPKEYCYNFILQHPDNRIVKPIERPMLILTNIYKISMDSLSIHKVSESMILNFVKLSQHFHLIEKYATFYSSNDEKLRPTLNFYLDQFCSEKTNCLIQGLVIHVSIDGGVEIKRYKVRNPNYEKVKKLKGNNPRLQFHYLQLRKEKKVKQYINFYGNEKEFEKYKNQMHSTTKELYNNYVNCYIKKQKPLMEYSEQFRTHMFHLHHEIYLKQLKEKKQKLTFDKVIQYVNNLEIIHQLYFVNYQLRQQNIEEVKLKTMENDFKESSN